ncbi:CoA activase [Myxococcota bacterium]|nr:CoA activase [Myxococcota bacterium]MBU1536631.1 CoA activase [Myxococcota bacterium]
MKENKYIGIDIGAENVRIVELSVTGSEKNYTLSSFIPHEKNPRELLSRLLGELDLQSFRGGAVTGRLAGILDLERVPTPKALASGFLAAHPREIPSTLVSVGAHGFSVVEMRDRERHILRENGRCSQGTGNFLRQLTERFGLTVEESDDLAMSVDSGAPLSGRCPVILKTDMTHLANKGESRERILAGLFDAVAENVEVLIKPALAPANVHLAGGVARSRRFIQHLGSFLESKQMELTVDEGDESLYYEAMGAAYEAHASDLRLPDSFVEGEWFAGQARSPFDILPPLSAHLDRVQYLEAQPLPAMTGTRRVILGYDMGSTGSKLVALDAELGVPLWDHYTRTEGNPVDAAKRLTEAFLKATSPSMEVVAMGATGSGREITGSMLRSCFGDERVFILNEIAAHARGATFFDPEVDTIFEIGGQDAKYIRLADGEIFDSAMNEACSAGTGSFIEEQGSKFQGVTSVTDLSRIAEAAPGGISLGQHCSVFMAEVIDQALGGGIGRDTVIAGIYDSIMQNYLNRVKGSRLVGKKIFCQGMPFSSRALAAAAARQTGRPVVVPPDPGLVGALGISLLTRAEITLGELSPVSMDAFTGARLISRDSFVCKSTVGCGGSGNKCRIDRLGVEVAGQVNKFVWGGSCSLYDKGNRRGFNLPDRAPDPFRERRDLLDDYIARVSVPRGNPRVGLTEEFVLKGLFPFFSTLLRELGLDPVVIHKGNHGHLKRGIEESNVPMCAPMQLYGGIISQLAEQGVEHLFMPMLRDLARVDDEPYSTVCPLSQASADILGLGLSMHQGLEIHTPVIDMGEGNLRSRLFIDSVFRVAQSFGVERKQQVLDAYATAYDAQRAFERQVTDLGRRAIDFAREHDLPVIVVLGRAYTIYNDVLNSNVPSLLRELGAMAIPVDAYSVEDEVPVYKEVYWGYSQINLRAAHQIRKTENHYGVFSSNYSCGPDSFNLHFFSYIMDGKPFAIIETDGHSGDAGTKTRLEAFLYCVKTDLTAGHRSLTRPRKQLKLIELDSPNLSDVQRRDDILLFPRMGENAPIIAATLRGNGFKAESLPMPGKKALTLGRKYSSGKECLPAVVTLGSLLERVEGTAPEERFAFFMPTANGPCRFGMYNMYHKVVLKDLGLSERVSVVSQPDSDYFAGVPKGLALKSFAAFVFGDMLHEALLDVRPLESIKGKTEEIYNRYYEKSQTMLESTPAPSLPVALMEIAGGLFGLRGLLRDAFSEMAAIKESRVIPRVSVVGEIYVRLDPFSNDFIIKRLEERGIGVKFAPFMEWLEYTDHINGVEIARGRLPSDAGLFSRAISSFIQLSVLNRMYEMGVQQLKWPRRTKAVNSIEASKPYIRQDLVGEAILTLGGPVHEYQEGLVNGVVSVGPLECMPNKIAEAQYFHVSERIGMPALTIALNGEPMDLENLDNFVYEVKKEFQGKAKRRFDSSSVHKVAGV